MRSKRKQVAFSQITGKIKKQKKFFLVESSGMVNWLLGQNYSGNTVRQNRMCSFLFHLWMACLLKEQSFLSQRFLKTFLYSYHNLKNLVLILLSKLTTLHLEIWFVSKFCLIITHLLHVFFWQSGHLFIHSIDTTVLFKLHSYIYLLFFLFLFSH